MPLLGSGEYRDILPLEQLSGVKEVEPFPQRPPRRQSQHSTIAKTAIMSHLSTPSTDGARTPEDHEAIKERESHSGTTQPSTGSLAAPTNTVKHSLSNGAALTDTPMTTAPNSPIMYVY